MFQRVIVVIAWIIGCVALSKQGPVGPCGPQGPMGEPGKDKIVHSPISTLDLHVEPDERNEDADQG